MIKYLLLALLIAWLFFSSPWGRQRPSQQGPARKPATPPAPQQMVACAHCGVHLPANEALLGPPSANGPHPFCSEDHRRAGSRAR